MQQIDQRTGGQVPKRQAEQLAVRAAQDFETFYEQRVRPANAMPVKALLAMSSDSKGITMLPGALREATRKAAEEEAATAVRGDPMAKCEQRVVQIWHRGKRVQLARRVDVYANCFVKRDHATKALQPSRPAQQPENSLRMSDFDGSQGNIADDDKEVF